ncbi:hypothetical protein HpDR94b_14260 [Helicobacter pylori]
MAKNNQSQRLSKQHKESLGVANIFTDEARLHDMGAVSLNLLCKNLKMNLRACHLDTEQA